MSDENILTLRNPLYNISITGEDAEKTRGFKKLISAGIDRVSATLSPYFRRGGQIKENLINRVSYVVTNLPRYVGGVFNRMTHRTELNALSLYNTPSWARESATHELGHAAFELNGTNSVYTRAGENVWGDMFSRRYGERYRDVGKRIGSYVAHKIALEGLATVVQEDADGVSSTSAYTREKFAVRKTIEAFGPERVYSPTEEDARRILPYMIRVYSAYRPKLS